MGMSNSRGIFKQSRLLVATVGLRQTFFEIFGPMYGPFWEDLVTLKSHRFLDPQWCLFKMALLRFHQFQVESQLRSPAFDLFELLTDHGAVDTIGYPTIHLALMSTLDTPTLLNWAIGIQYIYQKIRRKPSFISRNVWWLQLNVVSNIFKSTESLTCVDWDIHCLAVHADLKKQGIPGNPSLTKSNTIY